MHPYGSDRVRVREDGAILLSCRLPKPGWTERVPKTLTHAEHPGTAILWDDAYYEVVAIEVLANGVEYSLTPWSDAHIMRLTEAYDAASEAARAMDRRDILRRSKAHKTATLLGFLTGHLPAAVQQDLAHEIGINAVRLTEVSAIPELVPAIVCLNMIVGARIGNASAPRIPLIVLLLAGYMLLDGAIRFKYAWLNNRPMGSVFGLIGYGIYYLFAPHEAKRVAPLASEKGWGIYEKEIDADVKLRDAVRMREPLFTLLSAREQQRIAERYDFDYRRHASAIAWVILVFALLGAATEFNALRHTGRTSALISMLTAGYLGSEQIYRLTILGKRPVGSAIGYLVRPFLRRFL